MLDGQTDNKLSQRIIHEAPPVSLAALGNLDNTLREQVARSGSPNHRQQMSCQTSAMIAMLCRRLMPELSWYRHRMCVFQEA